MRLPPVVGGSTVHLLLGNGDLALEPVLLRVLPSGVGVYRSVFTDIYGSNIIFAGPHKSFSYRRIITSNAVYSVHHIYFGSASASPGPDDQVKYPANRDNMEDMEMIPQLSSTESRAHELMEGL